MRKVLLYRASEMEDGELEAAEKAQFYCTRLRTDIRLGDIVVSRYSALPFFKEQESDILSVGGTLINSYDQHLYVADLQNWVYDLKELTPMTWSRLEDIPDNEPGPFVLKGETNSKKSNWNKFMFAENKKAAIDVYQRLTEDGLLCYQKIYIRKYIPLMNLGTSIGGCPISKEFRFFVYKDKVLSGGFYWSSFAEDIIDQGFSIPSIDEVPLDFLNKAINCIKDKTNFYTIDVAQTKYGEWIVIELNCGNMSGISANDPNILYKNLYNAINV